MRCTCLIPFYNERDRIVHVLDQVVKIPAIDEIICVDDGSTDGTSEVIKKKHPTIAILRNAQNVGKTGAIKAGVRQAKGEYVLLLDADLQNIQYQEIETALHKTFAQKNITMVVLRRMNAPLFVKIVRGDILVSGERLIKKDILKKILQSNLKNYQVEFATNQYMLDNKKNVYWMPSSAQNTFKFTKIGFMKGWYEMITAMVDCISYVGTKNYVKQVIFFCRKAL